MSYQTLWLYSEESPTPREYDTVKELLLEYKRSRGIDFHTRTVADKTEVPVGHKILVFGNKGTWRNSREHVYTYSAKQFVSRANAATVFFNALDNYFDRVEGLPDGFRLISTHAPLELRELIRLYIDLEQPVAVDVETGGILGENVSARNAPLLTVALAQGGVSVVFENLLERGSLAVLKEVLTKIKKPIYHNAKFDVTVLESRLNLPAGSLPVWFDTMLAHHALNHAAREHGLKALCKRYFNAADWEADIKKYLKGKDYSTIPRSELARYNAYDVLWTYRLWQKLDAELEADEEAHKAYLFEMEAARFLRKVEDVGIPYSLVKAQTLEAVYRDAARIAKQELQNFLRNYEFNPGSPQQVKKALDALGYTVNKTDEETLTELRERVGEDTVVGEVISLILSYRKAMKMNSTYVQAWGEAARIEGDSRVHATYMVHGTTTGRLSSSTPNAQNVPRDKMLRRMVTLDEYNKLSFD